MKIIQMSMGIFETNTYILHSEAISETVIVDPAISSDILLDEVRGRDVSFVVNTHGHFDHIGGNRVLKEMMGCQIVIHQNDALMLEDPEKNLSVHFANEVVSPPADIELEKPGDFVLKIDGFCFDWVFVPGHTSGGIALYDKENAILISGDFIFKASCGRTDFPEGSELEMRKSLKWVETLPDETMVYPGHKEKFQLGDFKKLIPLILK